MAHLATLRLRLFKFQNVITYMTAQARRFEEEIAELELALGIEHEEEEQGPNKTPSETDAMDEDEDFFSHVQEPEDRPVPLEDDSTSKNTSSSQNKHSVATGFSSPVSQNPVPSSSLLDVHPQSQEPNTPPIPLHQAMQDMDLGAAIFPSSSSSEPSLQGPPSPSIRLSFNPLPYSTNPGLRIAESLSQSPIVEDSMVYIFLSFNLLAHSPDSGPDCC